MLREGLPRESQLAPILSIALDMTQREQGHNTKLIHTLRTPKHSYNEYVHSFFDMVPFGGVAGKKNYVEKSIREREQRPKICFFLKVFPLRENEIKKETDTI